jgi:hypothetical protein
MLNARNAQSKLYIYYKEAPTNKGHKPPAPRGEAKRARHHRQMSKRAQNSQAPPKHMHWGQRACKAHLHTWKRAKSKTNQVARPRPHTWRSHNDSPWCHHPQKWCTSMSPPGYEAGEPPLISTKCSLGLPPAIQNQERERANASTLGLVPKVENQCRAISSKVGLATLILPCISIQWSILSNPPNLEPPWDDHSYLIGVRVPRKKICGL